MHSSFFDNEHRNDQVKSLGVTFQRFNLSFLLVQQTRYYEWVLADKEALSSISLEIVLLWIHFFEVIQKEEYLPILVLKNILYVLETKIHSLV